MAAMPLDITRKGVPGIQADPYQASIPAARQLPEQSYQFSSGDARESGISVVSRTLDQVEVHISAAQRVPDDLRRAAGTAIDHRRDPSKRNTRYFQRTFWPGSKCYRFSEVLDGHLKHV